MGPADPEQPASRQLKFNALLRSIGDLGWAFGIYAMVVGAPSILSLHQSIFVDFELTKTFQWIVDGFDQVMDLLTTRIEPLIARILGALSKLFGWELKLGVHWRPYFALMVIPLITGARIHFRQGKYRLAAWQGIGGVTAIFVAAVVIGLVDISGDAASQAMIASLAVGSMLLVSGTASWLAKQNPFSAPSIAAYAESIRSGLIVTIFAAFLGATVSFVPTVGRAAGTLTTALVVVSMGLLLIVGQSERNVPAARFGLTLIGSFVLAGIVLIADKAVGILN